MITAIVVILVVLLVIAVSAAGASVRVLREYERGVVFRLGRLMDQRGPGVNSKYTTYSGETVANGETACTLAAAGTPCREVPDISAMADPYNGYAEYCTGNANTPQRDDIEVVRTPKPRHATRMI